MPPHSAAQEFRDGVVQVLPVTLAIIPFALILGASAVQKGLSVLEVALMSALVFAGAAQFVAIDLWSYPAPWAALALATLLVNLRFVLMSASLARHVGRFGPAGRAAAAFVMVDEIWAMAERRALVRPLTPAYYAGAAGLLYLNWVAVTTLGAVLGALIADPEAYGFDFAFTAIFIVLVAGLWKRGSGSRSSLPVAIASGAAAVAVERLVPGAWFVLAGALAGAAVAALPPAGREPRP